MMPRCLAFRRDDGFVFLSFSFYFAVLFRRVVGMLLYLSTVILFFGWVLEGFAYSDVLAWSNTTTWSRLYLFELFVYILYFFGWFFCGHCYCSDCNDKKYEKHGGVNGFRITFI